MIAHVQGGSRKSKLLTQYNSLLFLSHPVYCARVCEYYCMEVFN